MSDIKSKSQYCILVVEDDPGISSLIVDTLERSHYKLVTATNGIEALQYVKKNRTDLILLDVNIPKLSGFEVCKKIKENFKLQHIPILMLTAISDYKSRIKGLDLGADDYIVKPFNIEELIARVRTNLRRSVMDLDASPLTRLPGNNTIERIILRNIQMEKPFSLLYLDLKYFKAYNDFYGFPKGDNVIKVTAEILQNITESTDDFVGHIGGDDFVIVTTIQKSESLCKDIIKKFDEVIPSLYSEEDRGRGYIETVNRLGVRQQFPLLTISIGVINNSNGYLDSLGKISKLSAEMKRVAKKNEGSSYAIDQRSS